MTTEQYGNDVELQQLEPQPTLSIRTTVQVAVLNQAQDDMLRALSNYLQQSGAKHAGPPFVRYHSFGDTETDLELGVPVKERVAGEGQIVGGELPGGPAITTLHLGGYDKLGDAYARIQAWLESHAYTPSGAAWEVYGWIDPSEYGGPETWPDPSTWRTQLVQPINES